MISLSWSPGLYVIVPQTFDTDEANRFLRAHGMRDWETDTDSPGEAAIEFAGRTCYMSFDKRRPGGNKAYINHVRELKHGSVFEHATWGIVIDGVSRSFSHQFVRQRVGLSPSQLSQRYVDEGICRYIVPAALAESVVPGVNLPDRFETVSDIDPAMFQTDDDYHAFVEWWRASFAAHVSYRILADKLLAKFAGHADWGKATTKQKKRAREAAREVVPNGVETILYGTCNARMLRHFIEMRSDEAADAQIRRVALMVLDRFNIEAPNIFGDYRIATTDDGDDMATTPHRKI
jgi:thymidylate synthase (FAD)